MAFQPVVTSRFAKPGQYRMEVVNRDVAGIDAYVKAGGYKIAEDVLKNKTPDQVIDAVKASKLRGRGGAGFPTGMKWGFVPKDGRQHYLVINADESEPGTFKDRYLIEHDPHGLIEGCIISAYAVRATRCYIYIRGEYFSQRADLDRAVAEAYAKGFLGKRLFGTDFDLEMVVYSGAGAYICGEETALLNSLEGKRGEPRLKPPFPAIQGLYGKPTVVNNVETIHAVPFIMERGGEWFAGLGTEKSGGTRMVCVSGHVKRPGVFEVPMTLTLRELIFDQCGGPSRGHAVKAVIPGGSSAPVLTAAELDVQCCFDALARAGTMGGSGGVVVIDAATCMVRTAVNVMHFYAHESCGQCSPCREGTNYLELLVHKIEAGHGTPADIDTLYDAAGNMQGGTTICALADAAAMPMRSYIEKFRDEFVEHVRLGRCPLDDLRLSLHGGWATA